MQEVLGAVSSSCCITRSPANSGSKGYFFAFPGTTCFFGFTASLAGFTISFVEIAEKEGSGDFFGFTELGVLYTQKTFCHELSDQALPIKPTALIVKVGPPLLGYSLSTK